MNKFKRKVEEMKSIAKFNKIVRNYLAMSKALDELKKAEKLK